MPRRRGPSHGSLCFHGGLSKAHPPHWERKCSAQRPARPSPSHPTPAQCSLCTSPQAQGVRPPVALLPARPIPRSPPSRPLCLCSVPPPPPQSSTLAHLCSCAGPPLSPDPSPRAALARSSTSLTPSQLYGNWALRMAQNPPPHPCTQAKSCQPSQPSSLTWPSPTYRTAILCVS